MDKARLAALAEMARRVLPPLGEGTEASLEVYKGRSADDLSPEERRGRAELRVLSGAELDETDAETLEAIILPDARPVYLIQGDAYGDPGQAWPQLAPDAVRETLRRCSKAVARIEVPDDPDRLYGGTGFLVGERLMMTNRHVARLFSTGVGLAASQTSRAVANFKAEHSDPGQPKDRAEIVRVVMVHPHWDMALLELDRVPEGAKPLELSLDSDERLAGHLVAVIGYPARDPRNNSAVQDKVFNGIFNVKRLQPGLIGKRRRQILSFGHAVDALTHDASTLGGNSGSAVIDVASGQIVGLHFAGIYLEDNFAVPARELARDPRVRAAGVSLAEGPLAADDPWGALFEGEVPPNNGAAIAAPTQAAPAVGVHVQQATPEGVIRVTVPIEITISVAPGQAKLARPPETDAVEEGVLGPAFGGSFVRGFAANYSLKDPQERPWFDAAWRIVGHLARGGMPDKALKQHKHTSARMVDAAGRYLKAAIAGRPAPVLGHQRVNRRPLQGRRYVIFSDHHITGPGHRQEFFVSKGNLDIYERALQQYGDKDYTLVENGDVEELIIWDPAQFPRHMEARVRWDAISDDRWHDELPPFLLEQRLAIRFAMLEQIIDGYPRYYDAIRPFAKANRLVRIAGNHDYNLQGKAFLDRLNGMADLGLPDVYDYLLLYGDRETDVDYAIMHGHQYDLTTNPAAAPRFGECFSECVAIWFQGGDRTWRWFVDGPLDWATGKRPFLNNLTEDNHDPYKPTGEPDPVGSEDLPYGHDHLGDDLNDVRIRVNQALDAITGPAPESVPDTSAEEAFRPGRDFFEAVFGHSVAWDHFTHDSAVNAVIGEAVDGMPADLDGDGALDRDASGVLLRHRRFFKYRHTNEQELARQLLRDFPDEADRPVVVFGHTHEPRLDSGIPRDFIRRLTRSGVPGDREIAEQLRKMAVFHHYANSASAGRFERLVWAIEIDENGIRLVSWARTRSGVERREWKTTDGLRAAAPSPVP